MLRRYLPNMNPDWAARLMTSLLYGVTPHALLIYATVVRVLSSAAPSGQLFPGARSDAGRSNRSPALRMIAQRRCQSGKANSAERLAGPG
jgi:hypothetical protein